MRTTWALVAAAAAICGAVALPAGIASADEGKSAEEVIRELESDGYTVRIDKIGTAPISECVVTNVRNPQNFSQLVPLLGGDGVLFPVTISQPISVSLDCSG